MTYLKINNTDFSKWVNELKVDFKHLYNSQTNAAGNTVVDKINTKREIEVGFIPLDSCAQLTSLINSLTNFTISLSFRNPRTNTIETINCVIPDTNIEYFTIRDEKVMYKPFTVKFIEL